MQVKQPQSSYYNHDGNCKKQPCNCLLVQQVWRPGIDPLGQDEELDYDPTAYDCLHKFSLEWPCLSFDTVRDDLGGPRSTFPHTVFMVAGTQVGQCAKPGLHMTERWEL